MIAYCGLVCHTCAIYLATREKHEGKKREMKADIARICNEKYGTQYKPEDITDCDGCRTEGGRLFAGCKTCYMRKCARDKGIEHCARCDGYVCEELEKLFATEPGAKRRLDQIRSGS
jgi:hypothetical protein